jgi:hypothetical protein
VGDGLRQFRRLFRQFRRLSGIRCDMAVPEGVPAVPEAVNGIRCDTAVPEVIRNTF